MQTSDKHEKLQRFSNRLESRLNLKGWTQREFANRLGVKESRVSNWVKGRNRPDDVTRLKIAELLDVDSRWLMGEIESEYHVRGNTEHLELNEDEVMWGSSKRDLKINPAYQPQQPSSASLRKINDYLSPWIESAARNADVASHMLTQLKLYLPHSHIEVIETDPEDD